MAIFGLFGGKASASSVRKHVERAGNKRAQDVDRWSSIQALAKIGTEDALAGLLKRFTFYVDSGITDQEEKDAAFAAIVAAGDKAIPPVVAFLGRSESIAWPLKILDALCERPVVVGHLLSLLEKMDTEYERDPQRKLDLIMAVGERPDPRALPVLERFLEDTNETARFNAVGALLAQAEAGEAAAALLACHDSEESLRVRNRILEGLADLETVVPDARRSAFQGALPAGITLDSQGVLRRQD